MGRQMRGAVQLRSETRRIQDKIGCLCGTLEVFVLYVALLVMSGVCQADKTIWSDAGGSISGSVVDSVSGLPVVGAAVNVVETGDQARTGVDGTYIIYMYPGSYTLIASAAGYTPQTVPALVSSNTVTAVSFSLSSAPVSIGFIADAKDLPAGTKVTISENLVATTASGTYNDGSCYVENSDRTCGIRILNGKGVGVGSRISALTGTIRCHSSGSGERCIDATTMNVTSGSPVGALGMDNKVLSALGTAGGSGLGQIITITTPVGRAVYQRNIQNVALVPIQGTFTGVIDRIEARATVMAGYNSGVSTDWSQLDEGGSSFSGTLTVPAGGWYKIEVQGRDSSGAPVAYAEVRKVGVGEVFITAGQSNSCNYGWPTQTPLDDRVSAWGGVSWQFAKDPQPIAEGTGGTAWPVLGTLIAQRLNVPVGLISVGVGGTSVLQWLPGGTLYRRLKNAVKYVGVGGARAILWHQGEADVINGTSAADYTQRLNTIINQSRVDAGYTIPWGIAHVSWIGDAYTANQPAIRQGQSMVVGQGTAVFQGPDTDVYITSDFRQTDGVHMNGPGLQRHGQLWADALKNSILKDVPAVAGSSSSIPASGLLIRIWGRVTKVTSSYIYIDDGSGYNDGSGNGLGFRVAFSGLMQSITKSFSAGTTYVNGVTGILSLDADGIPCVRPRRNADIDL